MGSEAPAAAALLDMREVRAEGLAEMAVTMEEVTEAWLGRRMAAETRGIGAVVVAALTTGLDMVTTGDVRAGRSGLDTTSIFTTVGGAAPFSVTAKTHKVNLLDAR